jgi:hypothetical protein
MYLQPLDKTEYKTRPEQSQNITLGFGLKNQVETSHWPRLLWHQVKQRILLSNEIAFEVDTNGDPNQQSFVNGMDTKIQD